MAESTIATSDEEIVDGEEAVVEAKEEDAVAAESTETNKTEATEEEKKEEEAPKVPEEYEDFTLPEGMEADEAKTGEFKEVAKDLGLTQESAQKLVDHYIKVEKASYEAQAEAWESTQKEWRSETRNDKDIGGQNLKATKADVGRAVAKFGGDDFKTLLDTTGVGDHVEMVRFLKKVGSMLGEDTTTNQGTKPISAEADKVKAMFPSMNQ